ncbi:rod shape-determining protein [Pontibacter sp. BT731]|uniref:rod shape-determining protein n=1 Tax=Pontibacter coccineus TaxID=3063328 RepID=UPI0026E25E54|nr:rod shape-determining protein [Pontibacter sp. BT731]MDO6389598.1 rod shape-determining protein [Pontibacter sp. BT731]
MLKREVWIEVCSRVTKVYSKGELIANEPTAVAIDGLSGRVEAFGDAALEFMQRLAANQVQYNLVWPVSTGITDFYAFEYFLRGLLNKSFDGNKLLGLLQRSYQMVFIVPSTVSSVDLRAWRDSGQHAGAAEVYFIHKPYLVMRGLGIDFYTTAGTALVEIGSSSTEIFVIANGKILANEQLAVGKNSFISSIQVDYKRTQNQSISVTAAERLLEQDAAVLKWVEKYYFIIEETLWRVLDTMPADTVQAIVAKGITLYGAGANSVGLKAALSFNGKLALQHVSDSDHVISREIGNLNGKGFPRDLFIR